MNLRPLVQLTLTAVLILVLASCTTTTDDDVVEAADDSAIETTDDPGDDAVAEGTDDEVADDAAAEEPDEAEVEATDDAVVEEADDDAAEAALDEDELDTLLELLGFESEDDVEAPELDLENMVAETPNMTFPVDAYDNTYVGTVTEDLYIAVSLDSMYADQAEGLSAYVCDGESISFYVTGELEDGAATLHLAEDAQIELTLNGETIGGSVTLNGQELQAFEASEATGDAGLYVASSPDEDLEMTGRWVVLEDGSYRGHMMIGPALRAAAQAILEFYVRR